MREPWYGPTAPTIIKSKQSKIEKKKLLFVLDNEIVIIKSQPFENLSSPKWHSFPTHARYFKDHLQLYG